MQAQVGWSAALAAPPPPPPPRPRAPAAPACSAAAPSSRHAAALPRPTRRPRQLAAAATKAPERAASKRQQQQYVQVEPDGSDAWRLDPVIDALKEGAVGIIPTGGCRPRLRLATSRAMRQWQAMR